jgi:hypothetical protein
MKREFLKELNIDDAMIDKIMAEHGKGIEDLKTSNTKLETQLEGVQAQMKAANEKIKGFDGLDVDGIKKQVDDWKTKYETETKTLSEKLKEQDFAHNAEKFLSTQGFKSELAKKAVLAEMKAKNFELKEGAFVGASEWIAEVKKSDPTAFQEQQMDSKDDNPPPAWGIKTGGQGAGDHDSTPQKKNFF